MAEIHGNPVAAGDTILVQTQVAKVVRYDESIDKFVYVIGEGNGVNYIEAHISNTRFEVINPPEHTGLAATQHESLTSAEAEVKNISDPVEEDPDTDRVKGDIGAKLPGKPEA